MARVRIGTFFTKIKTPFEFTYLASNQVKRERKILIPTTPVQQLAYSSHNPVIFAKEPVAESSFKNSLLRLGIPITWAAATCRAI